MEALALVGGFLYIVIFGFWIMGRIDRFLDSGGFSPDWAAEEEREAASKNEKPPQACGGIDSSTRK